MGFLSDLSDEVALPNASVSCFSSPEVPSMRCSSSVARRICSALGVAPSSRAVKSATSTVAAATVSAVLAASSISATPQALGASLFNCSTRLAEASFSSGV